MKISLRAITPDNYRDVISLRVSKEQEHLVAPNVLTLAQLQFRHEKTALAIYAEETPVGLIGYDLYDYDIWRLMIDEKYQGKGYARDALKRVVEILRLHGAQPEARTCIVPGNEKAKSLYESLGFRESRPLCSDDEAETIEMTLKL
ncbi:MAG: GNAT family N-acetyltransferase [Candidatus Hodarchaeota archaeon]